MNATRELRGHDGYVMHALFSGHKYMRFQLVGVEPPSADDIEWYARKVMSELQQEQQSISTRKRKGRTRESVQRDIECWGRLANQAMVMAIYLRDEKAAGKTSTQLCWS